MYLRTTRRKNKNGTVAEYYQLAQNKRHPKTKKPVARIVHNFGRADEIDREEMIRLCRSIARVCNVEVVEPPGAAAKGDDHNRKRRASKAEDIESPRQIKGLEDEVTELSRTVKELKQELAGSRKREQALRDSSAKYKTIFENANDEIIYVSPDGTIIEINDRCEELLGLKRSEAIGKNFVELGYFSPTEMEKVVELFERIIRHDDPAKITEFEAIRDDGTRVFIEVNPKRIEEGGRIKGILTITRDITERKQIEKELEKYRDHLEELVRERTADLEEVNTALRVMLEKAQELKEEMGEKVMFNVKKFVLPYLDRVRKGTLSHTQKVYLESLERNLEEITSPLMHGISVKFLKLTPTEIEISNYIKHGKTTKDIADLLHMSTRTIDAHRYNIRRKLGLNNKNENLRTHLLSLK